MYFRVFKKFRVCTCIHDTRYTIHDIDNFRVYTVTSLLCNGECAHSIARRTENQYKLNADFSVFLR